MKQFAAVSMLCFCLVVLSYAAGYQVAQRQQASRNDTATHLRASSGQHDELAELQQQLVNREVAAEIDRLALEKLRLELVEINQSLDLLRDENNFYKRLMQPDAGEPIVGIHTFKVFSVDDDPLAFRLEMLVQQTAPSHKVIDTSVDIMVRGFLHQHPIDLALEDMLEADGNPLHLHFRYFQTVSSLFRLPEGFSPVDFVVSLEFRGEAVEQVFPWRVELPQKADVLPNT